MRHSGLREGAGHEAHGPGLLGFLRFNRQRFPDYLVQIVAHGVFPLTASLQDRTGFLRR